MKRRRLWFTALIFVGAVLLAAGGFIFTAEGQKKLSGYCIGIGAAMAALGAGWLADSFLISAREDEEIRRIKEIEVNDERNVRIREKAGAMTARIMNYLLTVFIVVLGLTGADLYIILAAVGLLAAEFLLLVYFSSYYSGRM